MRTLQKNLLIVMLAFFSTKTVGQNAETDDDVKNALRAQNHEAGKDFISERA